MESTLEFARDVFAGFLGRVPTTKPNGSLRSNRERPNASAAPRHSRPRQQSGVGGQPTGKALAAAASAGKTRCYDTGASQGMSTPDEANPPKKGKLINIQTGNDVISSDLWSEVEFAPGKFMRHVVLPSTANTVSVGEVNRDHGLSFQWIEPSSLGEVGETFLSKAVSGHQTIEGRFEIMPLKVQSLTPERHDKDSTHVISLKHCLTASCRFRCPNLKGL